MRTRTNPDGVLVVEIDIELDVRVTFVFTRRDGPIVFCGVFCDYMLPDERVMRVRYAGLVHDVVLSAAKERALEACANHDAEPDTLRDPSKAGT